MDFYFIHNEPSLTKSAQAGGLGLNQQDINAVVVWQKDVGYTFSWHTGTHGDRCVYVRPKGLGGYNLPCIWLDGKNALGSRGNYPADADTVVTANVALFIKMYNNFYGVGQVVANANRNAPDGRLSFACKSCGKKYGYFTDSVQAGLSLNSYPPVCSKCGGRVIGD